MRDMKSSRLARIAWIGMLLPFLIGRSGAAEPENLAPSPQVDWEHPDHPTLGRYFTKTKHERRPLPKFDTTRDQLPSPIYDENTNWVAMYWKAWELAFRNFHEPARGSGYVSQFIDAAFNKNIFQWDTCFMTMFCNYAHPLVPGVGSLDNFYRKQYPDGEIPREIDRKTGATFGLWRNAERKPLFTRWGWSGSPAAVVYRDRSAPAQPPFLTLDALNHPIFSWAEREYFRVTGDSRRIALIYEPLVHYYRALQEYLRQGNGLYMTDWASMDNSPRNAYLAKGGCAIDTSSQMVLFANDLAGFAGILEKKDEAAQFKREAAATAAQINQRMWDPEKKFYFDLTWDGARAPVKTIAGFWPLIAGIPSAAQGDALAAELRNTNTFNRPHRVPTLAADQRGYDPRGGYWCGAVWAPTDTMVVRGLERYGHRSLARDLALNHLACLGEVFTRTGTVWENYAPDSLAPGKPAKRDFVGWTGLGPIVYLLEFAIGLKPDGPANTLTWNLASGRKSGCERYRFAGHVADLLATPNANQWNIRVHSDGTFALIIALSGRKETFVVKQGDNAFAITTPSR
jgi:Mannosylglycerate hydrolase MGH1-like glycoside hydrolase domain